MGPSRRNDWKVKGSRGLKVELFFAHLPLQTQAKGCKRVMPIYANPLPIDCLKLTYEIWSERETWGEANVGLRLAFSPWPTRAAEAHAGQWVVGRYF